MTIQSEKTFPKTKARKIKLLILDVDGILTTPDITLASNGSSIKSFNVRDGLGLKLLQNTGVLTAIISGRKSETVITRSDEVGINYVYEGVKDKLVPYRELLQKLKLRDTHLAQNSQKHVVWAKFET